MEDKCVICGADVSDLNTMVCVNCINSRHGINSSKSIKIVVNDIPPSNNEYMGNSHSYHPYSDIKKKWHWQIKSAIKHKPTKPYEKAAKPYEKAEVHIRYYFKNHIRHDPDNYAGKMILDPLVREGIIKDDSFDCITLTLSCGYDKKNPRTEVTITRIDE